MANRRAGSRVPRWAQASGAVGLSYLLGSVPFAQIFGRRRGVDLRAVGTGTVSGTGLYRAAGFGPLVVAGLLDIAKGVPGPLLAGRRTTAAALACGATVTGHNWSVLLGGAGGRGISPAMGGLLVTAPAGAAVLLGGLAVGKLARQTGLGAAVADVALVPVAARTAGRRGTLAAAAVLVPMAAKRLAGNAPPPRRDVTTYAARLLFDRDSWHPDPAG